MSYTDKAESFTDEEAQELERLEQEFEEAGGARIVSGSIMDNTDVCAGGNERAERIAELRTKRGDATFEVNLTVRLTVKVVGDGMSEEELAAIIGPFDSARRLERAVEEGLRLETDARLGYAPDGNREAWLAELVRIDHVMEARR